jgi:pectate lyase
LLSALVCAALGSSLAATIDAPTSRGLSGSRSLVRLNEHSFVDDSGPFLGLGASYFGALRHAKYDRARLNRNLAFLASKGFNYVRVLSMVSWEGLEIAPVTFTNRAGLRVEAWSDYWPQFRDLLDLASGHGLRVEVTVFADAQYVMPTHSVRLAHLDGILANIAGREHQVLHLEVANEAWQNGFPGTPGIADLRAFTQYLADRTDVPVAITSNDDTSDQGIISLYQGSAADLATAHFSRDTRTAEGGWLPVRDCYQAGALPGVPPVSSNEPIGPGSSVGSESDPLKLCSAAVFAYLAHLPAYVFHSRAGVYGWERCCPPAGDEVRFEDTPGIDAFQFIRRILPGDLASWKRDDGLEPSAPFTVFCNGKPNRYWPDVSGATNGCHRNIGAAKGDQFVCFPMGILRDGVTLEARRRLQFEVFNPLTGEVTTNLTLSARNRITLPQGPGAFILKGTFLRADAGAGADPRQPPVNPTATMAQAAKAFPTAEGFGMSAVGGRGGRVMEVTNLEDAGPGSLRSCLEASGPRICVFRVSGTITLKSAIRVSTPYLTVAGQTSPGGVQIRGSGEPKGDWGVWFVNGAHDIIVRHLRVRMGGNLKHDAGNNLLCYGTAEPGVHDVIFDHCSVSWGSDTQLDWYGSYLDGATFQWCLIAECFMGQHVGGNRAPRNLTLHHNLYANLGSRTPLMQHARVFDFRNNVIYNWSGNNASVFGQFALNTSAFGNVVGNLWLPGPEGGYPYLNVGNGGPTRVDGSDAEEGGTRLFLSGNWGPHCPEGCTNDWIGHGVNTWDYYELNRDGSTHLVNQAQYDVGRPFAAPPVTMDAVSNLLDRVLGGVGASKPFRDPIDLRIVQSVREKTGTSRGSMTGPWPDLASGAPAPPADSDHDGVPDAWETAHGLEPGNGRDGATFAANGYTYVENYLNELAGDPIPGLSKTLAVPAGRP